MSIQKSADKSQVAHIALRSKEAAFAVGEFGQEHGVMYKQRHDEISFSAGGIRLSFLRNGDKTLTLNSQNSKGIDDSHRDESEKHQMNCVLSLVGYLSKDKLELQDVINSKIAAVKPMPIAMLWVTNTYAVLNEGQPMVVEYSQVPREDRGSFSTQQRGRARDNTLVVPFKLITDPPQESVKPNAFLFTPEPVYPTGFVNKENRFTDAGYAAMGGVLFLAKHIAAKQKLTLILPNYLDPAAKAKFAHLGNEDVFAALRK